MRQYVASDGRLQMTCDIQPLNSQHNYTRSYYMNGRDYIVSGSCEENIVRICCARTGRRLRDVVLEVSHSPSLRCSAAHGLVSFYAPMHSKIELA